MPGAVSRISRRSSAVSRAARAARCSACRRQPSARIVGAEPREAQQVVAERRDRGVGVELGVDLGGPGGRRPRDDDEARVGAPDGAPVGRQPGAIGDAAHGARRRHVRERLRVLAAGDPDDARALAHELAHARVLPGRAPVERVLGRAAARGRA